MPTLTYSVANFVAFTTIKSADVNSRFSDITTLLNSTKLDDVNLQDQGITRADKLSLSATAHSLVINDSARKVSETGPGSSGAVPASRGVSQDIRMLQLLLQPGQTWNLGLTLAAGVLTVTDAAGAALSSTNPGYVAIHSATSGQIELKEVAVATNLIEDESGTSDWDNEPFGTTASVAWADTRPFYLYAVLNDSGTIIFGLSPNPTLSKSPVTANIGYHGNAMSTPSDNGMFMLTAIDPTTNADERPCVRVGGVRATKGASVGWTFTSLDNAKGDGIRVDPFESAEFDFPQEQRGAAASNNLEASAGTLPTWASPGAIIYKYALALNGRCSVRYSTAAAGNATNGTGANQIRLALPYALQSNGTFFTPIGRVRSADANAGISMGEHLTAGNENLALLYRNASTVDNDDFSNTTDDLYFAFEYTAFGVDAT